MKKENREEDFIEELLGGKIADVPEEKDAIFAPEDFEEEEDGEKENEHEAEGKPEEIGLFEHGRRFFVPAKAVAELAKALGRSPKEVIEIYEKGCEAEKLLLEKEEAKRDSEVFEKLASMRGISKEEMKAEIFGALEKAKIAKIADEIQENNPGMNRKTAEELARFRLNAKKSFEEKKSGENEMEKLKGRLRELDVFSAKHRGEGVESLEKEVIDEWESGTPLEKAFRNFMAAKENEKLAAEIEKLKKEREKEQQKAYIKEHSPGSASSAAGTKVFDAFVEGLFKDY